MISKYKLFQKLIFLSFFILFSGYYVALMSWSNFGLGSTRSLTIPLRLVLLFSLTFAFLLKNKSNFKLSVQLFILFSFLYYIRIFYELIFGGNAFHISETQFLLYFSAFVFFPSFLISQLKFDVKSYNLIFIAILFSTFLLSILSLYFYKSIIGTVARISAAISRDDNYISPLALSYCGALGVGLGSIFFVTNKHLGKAKKAIILIVIVFSLIPLFLGASRGSVFAMVIPFVFMIFTIKSVKTKFRILFIFFVVGIAIIILSEKLGSGLISRFMNIQSDIESGSSSSIRLLMWESSIKQFVAHPLFGNSLELDEYQIYPHNIFFEVLITTGLIGFVPFVILIYKGLKSSWNIFKNAPKYSWVAALFIQSLTQHLFSGSLYSSSWLFTSLILVLLLKGQLNTD